MAEAKAPKKRSKKFIYAVGRRKRAVARVRLYPKGSGKLIVNEKELNAYFPTSMLQDTAVAPLTEAGELEHYDVEVKVHGGGVRGQAESIRHGVARALVLAEPELRAQVKKAGYLTRDARKKERKKPGLKRARRAPQWAKR